jgi:hypothetical protein
MAIFAFYDPRIGNWKQLWLDEQGNVIEMQGAPTQDDSLVLQGQRVTAGGEKSLARAEFAENEIGIVHVELATSTDDGSNWQQLLSARLLPQPSQNEPAESDLLTPGNTTDAR